MPTVTEIDGRIIWGRMVHCPYCDEDFESFDETTPEGGLEMCDDCYEEDRYEEMAASL